jgi:hypothetical protein
MVPYACECPGCEVVKEATTEATALGLPQLHISTAHSSSHKQRPPKVDRPRLAAGVTAEEWATFSRRWEIFKSAKAKSLEVLGTADIDDKSLADTVSIIKAKERAVRDVLVSQASLRCRPIRRIRQR